MRRLGPAKSRWLLLAAAVVIFASSATTNVALLAGLCLLAPLLFWRGALRIARRVFFSAVPITAGLALCSWTWLWLLSGRPPSTAPFIALGLRVVFISYVSFAVLDRVDLLGAAAPFPTLSRLLVITLAQIHALRLLASESRLGLRSRMLSRPRVRDLLRSAGTITGVLLLLSLRQARDTTDALRSRGLG